MIKLLSNKTFSINGPGTMPLIVLTKLSNLGKQAAPIAGEVLLDVNSLCIIKNSRLNLLTLGTFWLIMITITIT